MNKLETTKILSILKTAYPTFYKDLSDVKSTVELWSEMFSKESYEQVMVATKELINEYNYPPTIATVKNKIYSMTHTKELTNNELWDSLVSAIRNGYYGYNEEFNKLPEEVKEYLKSPRQLQELSCMNSSDIHTVVKGQFLKQIEIIKNRKKDLEKMLPETRKYLENIEILRISEGE